LAKYSEKCTFLRIQKGTQRAYLVVSVFPGCVRSQTKVRWETMHAFRSCDLQDRVCQNYECRFQFFSNCRRLHSFFMRHVVVSTLTVTNQIES